MYKFWKILKWALVGVLFVALFSLVTMQLWNWLIPELFHGPVLTFWQALGLLILAKIIFWSGRRHNYGGGGHYWKRRMQEKLRNMSPEEREAFRRRFQERCWGHRETRPESPQPGNG